MKPGFGGGSTTNQESTGSNTITKGFGYYETIAGGSGAGASWDGTSGVHTHMTNTRITDCEVFERRYPVILREFSLRGASSAGAGLHRGGRGVVRDIEFRIPVQVSILSERRVYAPYGLEGGGEGRRGENWWMRRMVKKGDGVGGEEMEYRKVSLGGKNTAAMQPGERIVVCTPGGGGWGKVGGERKVEERKRDEQASWRKGSIAQRMEAQETV